MSTKTANIIFKILNLEVTGNFIKGEKGDRINPDVPPDFTIEEIWWEGKDITQLFNELSTKEDRKEIERKCIEQIIG